MCNYNMQILVIYKKACISKIKVDKNVIKCLQLSTLIGILLSRVRYTAKNRFCLFYTRWVHE